MHADWLAELNQWWVQPRFAAADAIVCCSGHCANGIRAAWPGFASRVHVIYNGAAPEELVEIGERPPAKKVTPDLICGARGPGQGAAHPDRGIQWLGRGASTHRTGYPGTDPDDRESLTRHPYEQGTAGDRTGEIWRRAV
jgi:hypothetical protein